MLGLKAQNRFCRGMPLSPTFGWHRRHSFFVLFCFWHYRNKWSVLLKLGHQQSYAIIRVPSALSFSNFAILLPVMKVIKNQSLVTRVFSLERSMTISVSCWKVIRKLNVSNSLVVEVSDP